MKLKVVTEEDRNALREKFLQVIAGHPDTKIQFEVNPAEPHYHPDLLTDIYSPRAEVCLARIRERVMQINLWYPHTEDCDDRSVSQEPPCRITVLEPTEINILGYIIGVVSAEFETFEVLCEEDQGLFSYTFIQPL